MADGNQQLEMPKEAQKPASPEVVIRVMPAEFRGGKTPMTPPPKPVAPPPPPPKPVVPPKPPVKHRPPTVLIVGLVVLALVIAGAAYALSTLNKTTTPSTNTVVNTEPVKPKPECSDEDPCDAGFECNQAKKCAVLEEPEPATPVGGADTDSDGLTDIEEVLFGSDPRDADTDHDSYLDGNEVYHLYNPRGDAPGLLIDTGFARDFTDDAVDYTVSYPSRWTTQLLDRDTQQVVFRVPTDEYVQIEAVSKDATIGVSQWYLDQYPTVRADELSEVTTRQGYTGIVSPDKMTTYLDFGETVYVVSYHLNEVSTINFLTTYQMIVNSFVLEPEA
ncbi:MAG: thrombospondin type 3 repeat-containing protein [Patescibacteria group bacterium]